MGISVKNVAVRAWLEWGSVDAQWRVTGHTDLTKAMLNNMGCRNNCAHWPSFLWRPLSFLRELLALKATSCGGSSKSTVSHGGDTSGWKHITIPALWDLSAGNHGRGGIIFSYLSSQNQNRNQIILTGITYTTENRNKLWCIVYQSFISDIYSSAWSSSVWFLRSIQREDFAVFGSQRTRHLRVKMVLGTSRPIKNH